jgi:hypothetical protein
MTAKEVKSMFPYDNIVAGILVLIVAFTFHWIGQLVSLINWDWATSIGLQEKGLLPEYKVYEHAIAVADVTLGWLYGIAGAGLIAGTTWGYKLSIFTGAILIYHGISVWFWENNRRKAGHTLFKNPARVCWSSANIVSGMLAILVAWKVL